MAVEVEVAVAVAVEVKVAVEVAVEVAVGSSAGPVAARKVLRVTSTPSVHDARLSTTESDADEEDNTG
jgi:hypothetical protein